MNQETRNRLAESIMVISLLLAAWYVLAEPQHGRAAEANERIRTLEAELSPFRAAMSMMSDTSELDQARIEMLLELAAPKAVLADHELILSVAKDHSLEIERINPGPDSRPSPAGPLLTASGRFDIETAGAFANVAAFLSGLANDAPMMVVDHFQISPSRTDIGDTASLSASIRVGRIWAQRIDVAEVQP